MRDSITKKTGKKALCLFVICALAIDIFAFAPLSVSAAAPVKVLVNGQEISFPDAQPFIDGNGRTQVPIRFIAEAMNAKVEWVGSAKRVDIERGRITISMTIGVNEIVVLKVTKMMDTAPVLQGDRTFVPLRFISEGLGATIQWESATRTVRITDTGKDSYAIGAFNVDIEAGDNLYVSSVGTLTITKESGMNIYEEATENRAMVLDIRVDNPDMDIPAQRKEAEALLKQRLSIETVNEIMEYSNTDESILPLKYFEDANHDITVSRLYFGAIRIRVYPKETL